MHAFLLVTLERFETIRGENESVINILKLEEVDVKVYNSGFY